MIAFHEKDMETANWLKKRIGYGNINKRKDQRVFIYSVSNFTGLKHVLELVNGKFLTNNKIAQLYKYKWDSYLNMPILPTMDENKITNTIMVLRMLMLIFT